MNEKMLKEFVGQHLSLFQDSAEPPRADLILSLTASPAFVTFTQSLLPYFGGNSPFLAEMLQLKFQELLLHLLELDTAVTPPRQLQTILLQIYQGQKTDLDYLMSTYLLKPLSMSELARLSGRSLSAFKRDFEAHFYTPPGHWMRHKRLEHAQFLLRSTPKNVSEVSMEIGYESVSHFIKAYKQQYGTTPKRAVAAKAG